MTGCGNCKTEKVYFPRSLLHIQLSNSLALEILSTVILNVICFSHEFTVNCCINCSRNVILASERFSSAKFLQTIKQSRVYLEHLLCCPACGINIYIYVPTLYSSAICMQHLQCTILCVHFCFSVPVRLYTFSYNCLDKMHEHCNSF